MNISFLKKKNRNSRDDSPAFRDWPILLITFLILLLITSITHFMGFISLFDQSDVDTNQTDEIDITIFKEAASAYSVLEEEYLDARDTPPSIGTPTR